MGCVVCVVGLESQTANAIVMAMLRMSVECVEALESQATNAIVLETFLTSAIGVGVIRCVDP